MISTQGDVKHGKSDTLRGVILFTGSADPQLRMPPVGHKVLNMRPEVHLGKALLQFKWCTSLHPIALLCLLSRARDIQHTLKEHVMQTQEWQQNVDAQLSNFNNTMQQQ
uniref:Uncharacterized protein n=1 Tax=Oryza barthii TaxID=65489 RepID=A0A0D3GQA5_9ORYZ